MPRSETLESDSEDSAEGQASGGFMPAPFRPSPRDNSIGPATFDHGQHDKSSSPAALEPMSFDMDILEDVVEEGMHLAAMGRYKEALEKCQSTFEAHLDQFDIFLEYARLLFDQGDMDELLRVIKDVSRRESTRQLPADAQECISKMREIVKFLRTQMWYGSKDSELVLAPSLYLDAAKNYLLTYKFGYASSPFELTFVLVLISRLGGSFAEPPYSTRYQRFSQRYKDPWLELSKAFLKLEEYWALQHVIMDIIPLVADLPDLVWLEDWIARVDHAPDNYSEQCQHARVIIGDSMMRLRLERGLSCQGPLSMMSIFSLQWSMLESSQDTYSCLTTMNHRRGMFLDLTALSLNAVGFRTPKNDILSTLDIYAEHVSRRADYRALREIDLFRWGRGESGHAWFHRPDLRGELVGDAGFDPYKSKLARMLGNLLALQRLEALVVAAYYSPSGQRGSHSDEHDYGHPLDNEQLSSSQRLRIAIRNLRFGVILEGMSSTPGPHNSVPQDLVQVFLSSSKVLSDIIYASEIGPINLAELDAVVKQILGIVERMVLSPVVLGSTVVPTEQNPTENPTQEPIIGSAQDDLADGSLQQPPRHGPDYPNLDGAQEEDYNVSVVGPPDISEPALRSKSSKLQFTSDEDALLSELREQKDLTWQQIVDFFPGRSSDTLQLRYTTKLKDKSTIWTDEIKGKLRQALEEYKTDQWRIVSKKVGNGMSAAACQAMAKEMYQNDEPIVIPTTTASLPISEEGVDDLSSLPGLHGSWPQTPGPIDKAITAAQTKLRLAGSRRGADDLEGGSEDNLLSSVGKMYLGQQGTELPSSNLEFQASAEPIANSSEIAALDMVIEMQKNSASVRQSAERTDQRDGLLQRLLDLRQEVLANPEGISAT